MAEQVVLICDMCGKPAIRSVTLRVDGRNLVLDLCDADTRTLTRNAHAPKPGRKAAAVIAAPTRRGRPLGSKNKATKKAAANGRRRKSANGRRRRRKAST